MAKSKPTNPFYVLLVLAGVAFAVTACAYGVMAFTELRSPGAPSAEPHPLLVFMDKNGVKLMLAEVAVLALATFGAMGLDSYWTNQELAATASQRRDAESAKSERPDSERPNPEHAEQT
jgi:hypothetical protein